MKKNHLSAHSVRPMGEVRIIAGLWRGRKLPVLNADGLRPTTDRVKETLFNWLMHDIAGARCLDCFAGSGSLGFEALSRQAQAVIFLEKFAKAAEQLTKNLVSLKASNGSVIQTDTLQFLAKKNTGQPFDVVFIDPPFQQNLVPQVIERLIEHQWLADNVIVYVETELNHPSLVLPPCWQLVKEKKAGQVMSRLFSISG